ncbi:coronin-1C-A-like [Daphnia carinata]|uniref:coronin-1C-A-like n=1 Tax=Daphnia carinata TaxID=120202 RepID=UPI00257BFB32|nr:coronin-1C-A-like [Daphnia carinata]XP_057369458.1 coronin-1C-A-like [Daphnia carinata]
MSVSHRVVRASKFRNVYGTGWKRDLCYDNIKVSKSSWDATFCSVNPKFIAVITESAGGGAFIVLPITKEHGGKMKSDCPAVSGHKGPVLDIAFSPHNENLIASGSEDCSAKLWNIPDGGLTSTMTEPFLALLYHQRRVGLVLWHPAAESILLTAGSDNLVVIWNADTGEPTIVIDSHPDLVYSACWNWNGSKLLTTCKDKKIRIINPRAGIVEEEAVCHEGSKASRAIFLRNGLIFTTGFSKVSERQYSLRESGHLSNPMVQAEVDTSNGVMFPFYDSDTNIIYLCGKGDSVIRYFEVTPEPPFVHYINTFQTPDPQRGIGMMPKRGCDIHSCEITRFYRLNSSGLCQVITMTVPRKSELFQEDLYPETISPLSALSSDEWFSGMDSDPIMMSLKDRCIVAGNRYRDHYESESSLNLELGNIVSPVGLPKRLCRTTSLNHHAVAKSLSLPLNAKTPTREQEALLEEIARLKKRLAEQEERVRVLESLNHEERIRKLETLLQFKEKKFEQDSRSESSNYQVSLNNNSGTCYNRNTHLASTQSSPTALSMPITDGDDNGAKGDTFTTEILPHLPFGESLCKLSNFLSTPISAMGYELPSPMATAHSLASLPPVKALASFSRWGPIKSFSSSVMSSLTAMSPTNSPSKNAPSSE